jgi:hypothetical protein
MANPFPFVAGNVLTAAELNGIGEAWTSYTPTIKGGATTVTATITYAKYARVNKLVIATVLATVTSAGAANGAITVSLPIAAATGLNESTSGTFLVKDAGTAYYFGAAVIYSTTEVRGQAYNSADYMGANTPAFTLANNDVIGMTVIYQVA